MPLYFFDCILGDREELNLPLPARPGDICSPQTPTKFFKALHGKDSASFWMMRSRELVMEAHGFVFLRSSRQPNWPHPLHIYLLPLLTFRYNIAAPPALSFALPRSLSPSLNTGEREQGLSKVRERHDFQQETDIFFFKLLIFDMILITVNLFKRMNKATVFYATGQEENFADGFFPGFQSGAGSSFEQMAFSC
ncbi:hypothetical protein OIU74_022191 [Salix koriyanagi]|uniref:Uncharacterized protein n=1 Tax=Salix koriyanagi TaxID=2511006 RepID=A0A9Q1AEQ3_9ROSI|nr:hypothetical protein OIU74_022191 [Salix koriyanagi]